MNHMVVMEFRRSWLQLRRYPVEAVLSFAILAGMFFGISYGAATTFGSVPADALASVLLLSYLGWMLCMGLLSGPAAELETEAAQGTIEQVFCGAVPVARVMTARMLAGVAMTLAMVSVLAIAMGVFTSARLGAVEVLLLALACVTAAGGGFALAGVSLVVKRSRALVLLATFGMMPVMMSAAPAAWVASHKLVLLAPLVGPIGLARGALQFGRTPGLLDVACVALASLAYLWLGMQVFQRLRAFAMRRGTIGHY
jgi:ABC-2 type transport system permease protein